MESTYFSIFMFRNTVEPLFRGALIGLKSALSSSMKVKNTKVLAAFLLSLLTAGGMKDLCPRGKVSPE